MVGFKYKNNYETWIMIGFDKFTLYLIRLLTFS